MKIVSHQSTGRSGFKGFVKKNDKESDNRALQSPQTINCVDVFKVENGQRIFVEL